MILWDALTNFQSLKNSLFVKQSLESLRRRIVSLHLYFLIWYFRVWGGLVFAKSRIFLQFLQNENLFNLFMIEGKESLFFDKVFLILENRFSKYIDVGRWALLGIKVIMPYFELISCNQLMRRILCRLTAFCLKIHRRKNTSKTLKPTILRPYFCILCATSFLSLDIFLYIYSIYNILI